MSRSSFECWRRVDHLSHWPCRCLNSLSTIIDAQAVDEHYQPIDEAFQAVTREVSLGGIGLSHNREIDSDYLAIQLPNADGEQLQTVVKVLRSRPHNNTWDIGGEFITSDSDNNQLLAVVSLNHRDYGCVTTL